ncbi:hypothetical protein MJG53_003767 [Ovis ammon polii x Ovis aries]|uniref:Uncharacterized protein n=1 Tax=Ovis ammon polii x Ovis aries TaxID=2918886 RepID=A0ACB9VIJ6_9CETA|nr:hypothetical protein MJG53_003767 [Ovis ammon polii x Ovis aries]
MGFSRCCSSLSKEWFAGSRGLPQYVTHQLNCSKACEIFLDQGLNQCSLHRKIDPPPPDAVAALLSFPLYLGCCVPLRCHQAVSVHIQRLHFQEKHMAGHGVDHTGACTHSKVWTVSLGYWTHWRRQPQDCEVHRETADAGLSLGAPRYFHTWGPMGLTVGTPHPEEGLGAPSSELQKGEEEECPLRVVIGECGTWTPRSDQAL